MIHRATGLDNLNDLWEEIITKLDAATGKLSWGNGVETYLDTYTSV